MGVGMWLAFRPQAAAADSVNLSIMAGEKRSGPL
jgi:hypothetical protein